MKKNIFAKPTVAAAVALQAKKKRTNLLVNGDFATGDTTGWGGIPSGVFNVYPTVINGVALNAAELDEIVVRNIAFPVSSLGDDLDPVEFVVSMLYKGGEIGTNKILISGGVGSIPGGDTIWEDEAPSDWKRLEFYVKTSVSDPGGTSDVTISFIGGGNTVNGPINIADVMVYRVK